MHENRRKFLASLASLPALHIAGGLPFGKAYAASPMPKGALQKIAFGSCAMQWLEQPIWKAVLKHKPDLFLFLGDAIYGDFDGKQAFVPSKQSLLRDWAKLGAQPGYKSLREQIPVMATWDNHDYGKHDGGAEFTLKGMSKKVFLDFFDEPKDSARRQRDGVYDAKIFGPKGQRVQVILLDNRWFRGPLIPDTRSEEERKALGLSGSMGLTPNKDPSVTLLGEPQWQWLEEQLRKPADIRLINSGTQIVNNAKGMQEWGNFPLERKKLFDLIARTGAKGVVLLSGNVHYTEVSKTDEGPYSLYDFTSSGMTHNSPAYAEYKNPYRAAGPYTKNNFGLVEIDWQAKPAVTITLKTIALDGATAFEHRVSLSELR